MIRRTCPADEAVDADVCCYCLHPVDKHGPAGCEVDVPVTDSAGAELYTLVCPCSEHPPPYDPSDP